MYRFPIFGALRENPTQLKIFNKSEVSSRNMSSSRVKVHVCRQKEGLDFPYGKR